MGGNNVKGLYMMETIWPNDQGTSVIPPDKLEKEIQKGTIQRRPPKTQGGDEDMDEYVDACIEQVYIHYDPKGMGTLKKSVIKKFFEDALEIYALRCGKKSAKEVMNPAVKKDQAMSSAIQKVTTNPNGDCTKKEFVDFLNCYDLEEALGDFLGKSEFAVNKDKVQFIDTTQFKEQADAPKKVQYRDRTNFVDE